MINTADWKLDTVAVVGPDHVNYTEVGVIGLRLDGVPQRQGQFGMEWQYQFLTTEQYDQILQIWLATYPVTLAHYMTPAGLWQDDVFAFDQPTFNSRSTFYVYGVSMRFVPVHYTGSGLPITTGSTPTLYPGFSEPNSPPNASIAYTVSIYGDPQVVVGLNGSGSSDADGVIVSYAWSDNSAEYMNIPDYPAFETPHESSTATATFIYEYVPGMPNPKITLTVTDNAGLTGTEMIEVSIPALVASQALSGKKFAAAGGAVFVSLDGGLSFITVSGFDGNATAVACPGGGIVWGTDTGTLYWAPMASPDAYQQVAQLPPGEDGPALVTWLDVSPVNTRKIAAGTNKGTVALSINGGLTWAEVTPPGMAVVKVAWNSAAEEELGVIGTDLVSADGLCKITRDGGTTWQTDVSGLPYPSEGRAVQRGVRLRYAGLQGTTGSTALYAATGAAWLPVAFAEASADVQSLALVDNSLFVGDAQGVGRSITETTVLRTLPVGGGGIRSILRDIDNPNVALLGCETGLYKTLNGFESAGLIGLPGTIVTQVDWLRTPQPPEAELLIPTWGAFSGDDGLWWYSRLNPNDGWIRYDPFTCGFPTGWYWHNVQINPFDQNHWIMYGNTTGNKSYTLTRSGTTLTMVAIGTTQSPLWQSKDHGATWSPIPLRFEALPGSVDYPGDPTRFTSSTLCDVVFDRTTAGMVHASGTAWWEIFSGQFDANGVVFRGTNILYGNQTGANYTPGGASNFQTFSALASGLAGDAVMWSEDGGTSAYGSGNKIMYANNGTFTAGAGPQENEHAKSLRVSQISAGFMLLTNTELRGGESYRDTPHRALVSVVGTSFVLSNGGVFVSGTGVRKYLDPFTDGTFTLEVPETYVTGAVELDATGYGIAVRVPYGGAQTGRDTWVFDKHGWSLVAGPVRPTLSTGFGRFANCVGVIGR